jgi:hypothetical protein
MTNAELSCFSKLLRKLSRMFCLGVRENAGESDSTEYRQPAMDVKKEEFEARAAALIGKAIVKVIYCEPDWGDEPFRFFDDQRFDSIGFGLELTFSDGEQWTIKWGAEFCEYGVSLIKAPFRIGDRMLDASTSPRWCAIIGKRIISSEIFWSWVEEYHKPETRLIYPQDILLRFEGGKAIVFSALEIDGEHRHMGMMDNITVFDDIEMAKKFHCLDSSQ